MNINTSEKYDRITKQAGEVFGMGESPLLLRDDRKDDKAETESSQRVATVGVKCKPSAEHLIPVLFRWKMAMPERRSVSGDPRKQVNLGPML